MQIRLQKALAQAGVASRRKAEEYIAAGRVKVNGEVVRELGTKVAPARDLVQVDGKLLSAAERKVYAVLYKPPEMVTTFSDPQGRPTVKDCLTDIGERVFAVGRLDYDAEGALIVTNDGDLANRLMHPRYGVRPTYLAKVKGDPDALTLEKLRSGVRLEDGMAIPHSVSVQSQAQRNTWLEIVLSEGRPHLVKRLCAAVGHPVVRLFRARYAGVGVEGLRPGAWRMLSDAEVEMLRKAAEGGEVPEGATHLPARRHRATTAPEDAKPAVSRKKPAPFAQKPAPRGRPGPKGASRRPAGSRPPPSRKGPRRGRKA